MALRLRRGTDAERQTITPREGELIYTTDTKEVYIGDGTTQGGNLISAELLDDTSPSLGGNLDLNGNNITGTGNIDINGTITATGNINLGDGAEDNVIVGGQISSHLIPKSNADFDLGSTLSYWRHTYSYGATIDGALTAESIITDTIVGSDSTVIYNSDTGVLTADSIVANSIESNLIGSVFADDSELLVDGISGKVLCDIENNIIRSNDFKAATIVLEGSRNTDNEKAGIRINTDGDSDDLYSLFSIIGRNDSDVGQSIVLERGRGDFDTPLPLQDQDELSSITWFGLDTNLNSQFTCGIKAIVDEAPSAGVVPGQLQLATAGSSGVGGITIDSNQVVDFDVDNTVAADGGAGTADVAGGVAAYLKIKVAGTEYAMPLYAINT